VSETTAGAATERREKKKNAARERKNTITHLERDRLARERLDEDLHAAAQAQHQVQRRLLLDVVVGERAAVLELLAGEDQALLVRRDALLVLDLGLDVLDGVGRLDLCGCLRGAVRGGRGERR